jgi:hypothetical protein
VIVVQQALLDHADHRTQAAGLVRDSAEAVHDTTRVIVVDTSGVDSAKVWQRRAVQEAQRADALDRALSEERVARAEVAIATPTVDTAVALPASGTTEMIRQGPYTIEVDHPILTAADSGSVVGLRVALDTLRLGVRLGCGAAARDGVRPASVSVSGPSWARVRLDRVEQDPAVCLSAGSTDVGTAGTLRSLIRRVGVTVGYGALLTTDGALAVRPIVGIGLRVWP